MANISRRRVASLLLATVVILLVLLSSFARLSSTDAAWSDERTLTATFRAQQLEIVLGAISCERDTTAKPHNWITLSWDEPAHLANHDVVYDISWRETLHNDYTGRTKIKQPEFGPFFPDPEEYSHHKANIEITIQARVVGTGQLSEPVVTTVEGVVGSGVLRCGKN